MTNHVRSMAAYLATRYNPSGRAVDHCGHAETRSASTTALADSVAERVDSGADRGWTR